MTNVLFSPESRSFALVKPFMGIKPQGRQPLCRACPRKLINGWIKNRTSNREAGKAKKEVLRYYENNKNRMQYHLYREKGYMIGSGPIEAAHRNVIQQRMKLSGQRWPIRGTQQIAIPGACEKANQWNKLIQLINAAA